MSLIRKQGPDLNTDLIPNFSIDNPWVGPVFFPASVRDRIVQRTHDSRVTPNWKAVRKSGVETLPVNLFIGSCYVRTDTGATVTRGAQVYNQELGHDVGVRQVRSGSSAKWLPQLGQALNARADYGPSRIQASVTAQNLCRSRISDQKMNLAQTFAERLQTSGTLIHTVNRLASFALMLRKGNFDAARQVLGTRVGKDLLKDFVPRGGNLKKPPSRDVFANLWLEYSYAWRPLVADIYGAAELLAQVHLQNRPLIATAKVEVPDEQYKLVTSGGITTRVSSKWTSRAKIVARYVMDSDMLAVAQQTGLSNPLLLTWELLPYSFVVDWVLPIGDYIKNLSATQGLVFKDGWLTVITQQYSFAEAVTGEYQGFPTHGFRENETGVIIGRAPLSGWPEHTFIVKTDLGVSQITSALSLLNQVFSRSQTTRGQLRR